MRWKCTCGYDGTGFGGWQRQPDGSAVQNRIEAALAEVLERPVEIHGSGRTDAGVHARGQVFHFDADWRHPPHKLLAALHTKLPAAIVLQRLTAVDDTFHARYSATGKRYRYRIHRGRAGPFETRFAWSCGASALDTGRMRRAAAGLLGTHDFTAFSAAARRGRGDPEPDPVRHLWRLDIAERGRRIAITAEGSGFLYRMVRSIVGALHDVGRGRLSPADLKAILEARERTHRVVTAPAAGLCLERVDYPR